MKTIQKTFSILILFSLFSCINDISYKGEVLSPLFVLNGILEPDSTVQVQLFKSKSFMAGFSDYNSIDNAKVQLWKNGEQLAELKHDGGGKYSTAEKVQIGDDVKITATSADFPKQAQASVSILPKANFSVDTLSLSILKYYNSSSFSSAGEDAVTDTSTLRISSFSTDLRIKIQDPGEDKNFYRVSAELRGSYEDKEPVISKLDIYSYDPVFKTFDSGFSFDELFDGADSSPQMPRIFNNFFSDLLFDGKEYNLNLSLKYGRSYESLNFGYYKDDESGEVQRPKLELIVKVESLSKSMFLYLQSLHLYNGLESDFFSEPVQIYSNIEGGVGILASTTSTAYPIEINLK